MKKIRCAIYTRKSSEEGLDMEFNSLDAQRDACEAYIKSQKHEGWVLIPTQYNDGGFSGGNMERPAFKELLEDIKAEKIDIVVVYKVDRLTRSLMDFSKIIEVFDAHGASFVSITQQFNTTTSMGRLTLNMLLSFAQFEREITSERLRDKNQATRQKGLYVGGRPSIGYKRDPNVGNIVIDEEQAWLVRLAFSKYLEFKSVNKLHRYIRDEVKYRSPKGNVYTKGALTHMLKRKIYIGKLEYNGKVYDGVHEPIIDEETYNKVQEQLAVNKQHELAYMKPAHTFSLLCGKLFDDKGNYMSPSSSTGTKNKKYKYYISQAIIQNREHESGSLDKISAPEADDAIRRVVLEYLRDVKNIQPLFEDSSIKMQKQILKSLSTLEIHDRAVRAVMQKVTVSRDYIELELNRKAIKRVIEILNFDEEFCVQVDNEDIVTIKKEIRIVPTPRRGGKKILFDGDEMYNLSLVQAITRGLYYYRLWEEGRLSEKEKQSSYVRRLMSLRFLPPQLVEDILNGKQDPLLTIEKLVDMAKIENIGRGVNRGANTRGVKGRGRW